jgi:CO/xanthine dehydrogenase FAD-binding subunit
LQRSEQVRRDAPMLAHAASMIGNARIRHRGTLGGSLAHADPSAELPCAVTALGGRIVAIGPSGERTIEADDFFESFFTTALRSNELVREVRVDVSREGMGWGFDEFVRRAGDFAVVEVAAVLELAPDGSCLGAELVAGGVSDRPVRLVDAAAALIGVVVSDTAVDAAAAAAGAAVDPPASEFASSDYRRHLTGVMLRRAVRAAVRRAQDGGEP